MKLLQTFLIIIISLQVINAQTTGKIEYTESTKLEIEFEGMTPDMSKMMPQSHSLQK